MKTLVISNLKHETWLMDSPGKDPSFYSKILSLVLELQVVNEVK